MIRITSKPQRFIETILNFLKSDKLNYYNKFQKLITNESPGNLNRLKQKARQPDGDLYNNLNNMLH